MFEGDELDEEKKIKRVRGCLNQLNFIKLKVLESILLVNTSVHQVPVKGRHHEFDDRFLDFDESVLYIKKIIEDKAGKPNSCVYY